MEPAERTDMTDDEALKMLKARGFEQGEGGIFNGILRIWISDADTKVPVTVGRELSDLAEGKISLRDIGLRRDTEAEESTDQP